MADDKNKLVVTFGMFFFGEAGSLAHFGVGTTVGSHAVWTAMTNITISGTSVISDTPITGLAVSIPNKTF